MRILVVDVETTSLLPHCTLNPSNLHLFPHILEIAWIILDYESLQIDKIKSEYVDASITSIRKPIQRLTGISLKDIQTKGKMEKPLLCEFLRDLQGVDRFVAHNIQFDKTVLKAACMRNRIETTLLDNTIPFCTMIQSSLQNYNPPKMLSLKNLHIHLFGYAVPIQHRALNDAIVTLKCFLELFS